MAGYSGDPSCRFLPWFKIEELPPLTALAASTFATMLFPDPSDQLVRYQCAQVIGLDWRARYGPGEVGEAMPVLRRDLFNLLEFLKRFPNSQLDSRQSEGISAGYLLKYTLLLDRDTTVAVASVKKAIALLVKYEPVSARTLHNRWRIYQDVSHLWAALSDFRSNLQKVSPEWAITAWLSFMSDPRPVLAIAEHYRRWGTAFQPKGGRDHTVLGRTSWTTPAWVDPLPTPDFFNPELLYEGLSAEARELLERYRR